VVRLARELRRRLLRELGEHFPGERGGVRMVAADRLLVVGACTGDVAARPQDAAEPDGRRRRRVRVPGTEGLLKRRLGAGRVAVPGEQQAEAERRPRSVVAVPGGDRLLVLVTGTQHVALLAQ